MTVREAEAHWAGSLREGAGRLRLGSGVFEGAYSFPSRFENGPGTNPEELIAAAHASCFSMALSGQLGNAGMTAESIATTATITMEKLEAGPTVTESHLDVHVKIPGGNLEAFEKAAEAAKTGCPISRLLKAEITMTAKLES